MLPAAHPGIAIGTSPQALAAYAQSLPLWLLTSRQRTQLFPRLSPSTLVGRHSKPDRSHLLAAPVAPEADLALDVPSAPPALLPQRFFLADAAPNRLRKLARREATRASPPSAAITNGTERFHALRYGRQRSTLFDMYVPWDERVIASDAPEAEFTGIIPPHLRIKCSLARPTPFGYTDGGQVMRITDPY